MDSFCTYREIKLLQFRIIRLNISIQLANEIVMERLCMERQNHIADQQTATPKAANDKSLKQPRFSIGFILANDFALSAFANFIDVLTLANNKVASINRTPCHWSVLSNSMNSIFSSSGIGVQPNQSLIAPQNFDYIIVVGRYTDSLSELDSSYIDYLHLTAQSKITLGGIGTGSLIIHAAGLMEGYQTCLSPLRGQTFLEKYSGLRSVMDKSFIIDRDRLSTDSAAGTSQLASYIVAKHIGRSEARKALHTLAANEPFPPDKTQPTIPQEWHSDNPVVAKSLHMMQQNIDCPLSIDDIAKTIGHNKRQIERHFQQALATSPQAAFIDMRLNFARTLIETTNKPLAEIAIQCGFCDSSHLSRMFRRRFGKKPFDLRAKNKDIS